MIEGSTCDDLSFSAPKLVTPKGHALPSHRQRVGENRRRCVFGDKRCGKNAPKKGCICTHSRALPRDDHHLLGVHKARSSAQGPGQATQRVEHGQPQTLGLLRGAHGALERARKRVSQPGAPPCSSDLRTGTRSCATKECRRGTAGTRRTLRTPRRPSHARTMV